MNDMKADYATKKAAIKHAIKYAEDFNNHKGKYGHHDVVVYDTKTHHAILKIKAFQS